MAYHELTRARINQRVISVQCFNQVVSEELLGQVLISFVVHKNALIINVCN